MEQHGPQMGPLVGTRLSMCMKPQQTAEMNTPHFVDKDKIYVVMNRWQSDDDEHLSVYRVTAALLARRCYHCSFCTVCSICSVARFSYTFCLQFHQYIS